MTVWLALLALGGMVLCAGVPLLWLYLASQADSAALGVLGATATIAAMFGLLGAVNRRHQASRVRRGFDDTGTFPLEVTLVLSVSAAGVGLAVLFVA